MAENVVEFTESNFEDEVIKSDKPVLVDFWAEWCAPCRALTPTINKLADDYAGKVKIGKVNTDTNQNLAMRYQVRSIPTILLFRDGKLLHQFVGVRKEQEFRELLDAQG